MPTKKSLRKPFYALLPQETFSRIAAVAKVKGIAHWQVVDDAIGSWKTPDGKCTPADRQGPILASLRK